MEEKAVEEPSNSPLKVLFFEDIDIVFEDEKEFLYPQLTKLIQASKVPIIMSASSADLIDANLIEPYFFKSYQEEGVEMIREQLVDF